MPDPYTVAGLFTQPVYTVATLPPASSLQGALRLVIDADASPWTFHGEVAAGGGAIRSRVISDGTSWRLHY
jgi:hypothetical protein